LLRFIFTGTFRTAADSIRHKQALIVRENRYVAMCGILLNY
jgi:hypothetical protein